MIESAYDILHVPRDAGPEEVRRAYVRLVRRYPPEHFPEKFAALRRAYQQVTLSEDFIEEMFSRVKEDGEPLEMAGFLWGDRRDLKPEKEVPLTELVSLLRVKNMRSVLDGMLEKASAEKITWRE
ncbi:MAG: hypothetical protein LBP21_06395 [Synergistaceae bacterium]|jgi:hypothetical protein|nr:hypothetical protein [Synergistaceae bacterium]